MAMSGGTSSSSSRSSRGSLGGSESEMVGITEINITPFVDVVLVLLVIFMVTAPLIMKDVLSIKLPKTTQADAQSLSTISVVVTKAGQLLVNGQLQSSESLKQMCVEALTKNPEVQAVISADVEALHGDVIKAIDLVKSSGINQFAIQVEKTQE